MRAEELCSPLLAGGCGKEAPLSLLHSQMWFSAEVQLRCQLARQMPNFFNHL